MDEVGRPAGLLVSLIIGAAPAWRLGFGEPSGDPSFFYEEPERGCSSPNARVYEKPLLAGEAKDAVSAWLARRVAGILDPGERHWSILGGLLAAEKVDGEARW